MDQRAQSYITVARRIAMCPLSIDAREMLLASAGASKFTYGIELGSCQIKLEKQLRTVVSKALWSKGQQKSVDMLLTLCHRGHRIDPSQLKLFYPLKLTRRQLLKHVDLRNQYVHCWHVSAAHRSNFKDGRSNMVGPICNLQTICVALGWQWNSPFEFSFPLDDHHTLEFSILNIPEDYFLHLNKLLWTRASNARKTLRGIQIGIDKATTIQLLRSSVISQYDKGIMRAILTDAITTQHHLYRMKQVEHPICQSCWNETESLEHLFWKCPRWADIRKQHLDDSQLHHCLELPLCTQRTGCFLITPPQVQRMFVNHHRILNNSEPFPSLPHRKYRFRFGQLTWEAATWYLSQLRWPKNDDTLGISWIEFALDFEIATGLILPRSATVCENSYMEVETWGAMPSGAIPSLKIKLKHDLTMFLKNISTKKRHPFSLHGLFQIWCLG